MGSQIRPKQAVRQFAPSLTKKKATNLKRKNPTHFSLDQKKQSVDLHHEKVSNLLKIHVAHSKIKIHLSHFESLINCTSSLKESQSQLVFLAEPSLTKKKATNLKRKNPTRFSLDQKKQNCWSSPQKSE